MDLPPTPPVPLAHRRNCARLRTGLPARLIDVTSSYDVTLENLSQTGARIALPGPSCLQPGEAVVLRWAQIERFGQVIWVSDDCSGIAFEEEVRDHEMLSTRRLQDQTSCEGAEHFFQRKAAREWVGGRCG